MDWLIVPGVALTIVGLAMLVWCIATVVRAKRSGKTDEELRDVLQSVMPWNLAAMGLSGIGLMVVIVGILL